MKLARYDPRAAMAAGNGRLLSGDERIAAVPIIGAPWLLGMSLRIADGQGDLQYTYEHNTASVSAEQNVALLRLMRRRGKLTDDQARYLARRMLERWPSESALAWAVEVFGGSKLPVVPTQPLARWCRPSGPSRATLETLVRSAPNEQFAEAELQTWASVRPDGVCFPEAMKMAVERRMLTEDAYRQTVLERFWGISRDIIENRMLFRTISLAEADTELALIRLRQESNDAILPPDAGREGTGESHRVSD